jgi:hypothetical protein
MPRGDGRLHAWLAPVLGQPGEPFLPKVGEVYRVNTIIYLLGNDPAAARPAVVIEVPLEGVSHSPIRIVTRTSKRAPGVPHPADNSLQLDRDGVFSDLISVERQLWRSENVELLGVLPEPYMCAVQGRFS